MNDMGTLFKRKRVRSRPRPENQQVLNTPDIIVQPELRSFQPASENDMDFEEDFDREYDEGGDKDDSFQRTIECLCECFEKECFVRGKFDSASFVRISQTLFKRDGLAGNIDYDSFSLFKGKFISFMMRKVFIMLAMTRRQMDTMNNFFKAILAFICGANDNINTHIHAGYSSCVRECARRVDRRDTLLDNKVQECELYSLAFDTALFAQELVL